MSYEVIRKTLVICDEDDPDYQLQISQPVNNDCAFEVGLYSSELGSLGLFGMPEDDIPALYAFLQEIYPERRTEPSREMVHNSIRQHLLYREREFGGEAGIYDFGPFKMYSSNGGVKLRHDTGDMMYINVERLIELRDVLNRLVQDATSVAYPKREEIKQEDDKEPVQHVSV